MEIKHILIPVDGSPAAFKALDLAIDLAERYQGAALTLLHVMPPREVPDAIRRFAEVEHIKEGVQWLYSREVADNIMREAERHTEGRKVGPVKVIVDNGDPARLVCRLAADVGVDAIVMGTRGLSDLAGVVLGSVSHKVTHLAPCTVITVR